MAEEISNDFKELELSAVIGFSGNVSGGLRVLPNNKEIIYPIGCTLVVEDIASKQQRFLQGHTSDVICTSVSKSGAYVASGQLTHMGFKADIIVWDMEQMQEYARFVLHKVKIQDLAFSPNEKYLVSLGGQDDGSVVVWSLAKKEAICGSPAQSQSAGITECLCYSHSNEDLFVTGGDGTLRIWELDVVNRKIKPTDVTMGQIKRSIKCMELSCDERTLYCGTTTGDVLGINMQTSLFQSIGPEKDKFSLGVTALRVLKTGELLVGTGDGSVTVMKTVEKKEGRKVMQKFVKTSQRQSCDGAVTSIGLRGSGHQFYVGTDKSQMYRFSFADFTHELVNTCHYSPITDISFPVLADTTSEKPRFYGSSELFATCSYQDIRVWHTQSQKELLRITVPNMKCHAIDFLKDGSSIVSAWDDGRIRAFFPESGNLMFTVNDAHKKGVTAVATTSDCRRIVSGGGEGQVRVWQIDSRYTARGAKTVVTTLVEAMKEHTNAVSCIKVSADNTQCVSSSADATCIVWDLETFHRKQIMFASTLFRCVCFRPDECQIITSGTDRKIAYWELFDGSLIRELDGSRSGSINGMDITQDGSHFVTAGDDKLVKVWDYDRGEVTHVGLGHSSAISRAKICPNNKLAITVSEDGAIFIWKFPVA